MNRHLFLLATGISATLPWLIDSTLKSIPVLIAAGLAAMSSRRASAAKRHLLWFIAMAALLALPILSIFLPTCRVLPPWSGRIAPRSIAATTPVAPQRFVGPASSARVSTPRTPAVSPSTLQLDNRIGSALSIDAWSALSLAWAAGGAILLLRLCAAQFVLHRTLKRCSPAKDDLILREVERARAQLGLQRTVLVLLDPRQTIPFVCGLLRPRLVLPAESEQWRETRMRSVLLHELAHIKRNDIAIQWLVQIVCAVHWFNPLVWCAAWRLHVERERACDDLVLASGVRPSDYAEHLLHIATKLERPVAAYAFPPALAMAEASRLEGRLVDVLNGRLNRSGVTRALAVGAAATAIALIVPLAMLRAAEETPASDPSAVQHGGSDSPPRLDPRISHQNAQESHDPAPEESAEKREENRAAQIATGSDEAHIANHGEEKAIARLRLQQAELELKRVAELHQQKLISTAEYEKAKATVDLRRAELRGDLAEVARVELAQAETQLARLSELRRQKLVSETQFEEAKLAVEEARIRLKQRELEARDSTGVEQIGSKAVRKIPVLGDIPVLGRLFQTTAEEKPAKSEDQTAHTATSAEQSVTPEHTNGSLATSEMRVVALKYCEASATAPLIEQAMTAQKRAVHVLPDARSNSLVVVADGAAIDAAVRFIADLDHRPSDATSAINLDANRDNQDRATIEQALAAQKALVDAARARLQQAEAELKRLKNLRETQGARR
ncbi:MAG TPA: M56 family metallopeptidase [Chthoniobacteraceae bacterium]|nr:M56 family metallopeptidase [Chthoniobacteraceae bacterium]